MNLRNIYYLHEIGGKKTQEDYIWPPPGTASFQDKVFIVCDGVGGAENGELASRFIAEYVGAAMLKVSLPSLSTAAINDLLAKAQNKLVEYARLHGLNDDMATTFTLLSMYDDKAFIAWCGDSRVYHLRNGAVLYKTSDHSLVNTLVKKGELTEEEALLHPQKNIILKAIKADYSPIEAESDWLSDVQDGDYFMLCTDGLLENITERDIKFLLDGQGADGADMIKSFQQFCYNKTRDNYSMYLLQVSNKNPTTTKKTKWRPLFFSLFAIILMGAVAVGYYYYSQHNQKVLAPGREYTPKAISDSNRLVPMTSGENKNIPVDDSLANSDAEQDTVKETLPEFTITKSKKTGVAKDSAKAGVDKTPESGKKSN